MDHLTLQCFLGNFLTTVLYKYLYIFIIYYLHMYIY